MDLLVRLIINTSFWRQPMKPVMIFLVIVMTTITDAYEQHVHVHGHAQGSVILNQTEAVIELRIPALSVLGFEHHPKSQQERDHLHQAIQSLKHPDLFTFLQKKGWFKPVQSVVPTLLENSVTLAVIEQDNHQAHDDHNDHAPHQSHADYHSPPHDNHEETHAEIVIKRHYRFEPNTVIDSISTHLFLELPHVYELDLALIIGEKQVMFELNHEHHQISLTNYQ